MHRPPNIRIAFGILLLLLLAHGLVWRILAPLDPGLSTSGRLWAALLTLAGTVGLPIDWVRWCLGGLAGAVVLAVALDLAGRMEGPGSWSALIGPALLVLSPPFARGLLEAPEIALFAAVLLLAVRRTFDETGTPGAFALSALPWALIGAWCQQGIILLVAAFVHRLLYVRRYRQGRAHGTAVGVWLAIAAAGAAGLLAIMGGWGGRLLTVSDYLLVDYGREAPSPSGPAWGPVIALWRSVHGLALLPFLAFFWFAWKPRPVWYLATLTLVMGVAWMIALAWRPPAAPATDWALLPLLPLFYIVVGEAFRAGLPVLEAGGFRGRESVIVSAIVLSGFAVATAWPTLTLVARHP